MTSRPDPAPAISGDVVAGLEALVGPARCEIAPSVAVGGVSPRVAVAPADVEQLAEVLRLATESHLSVCAVGGGSKLDWGTPPSACDLLVRTTALDAVPEYDPENLTVAAGAGARVADLAELAARDGLVFPLDPPEPREATLGGVLATNDNGPRRLLRGGVRDVVLGLKAVLADGRRVKGGGRTIKNVTGYDVTRLFVGSLGSLGVVSEVTVRLLPGPACERVALVPTNDLDAAAGLAAAVLRSHLVPSAIALLSPVAARALVPGELLPAELGSDGPRGPLLVMGAEGHPEAVERHVRDVMEEAARPAGAVVTPDGGAGPVWSALAAARAGARRAGLPVEVKVSVPLSGLARVLRAIEEGVSGDGPGPFWWADAGSGTALLRLGGLGAAGGSGVADLALLRTLRVLAVELGGSLILTDGAASLAGMFDAWGAAPEGLGVMRALKSRFDPLGLLNPGRSPGGI